MNQNILNSNKNTVSNILLSFIPISFILGNLVLNINIGLFIIFSLYAYKDEVLKFEFHFFDKILVIFFTYIILIGLYNFFIDFPKNNEILIKSILFLRYFLLFIIIRVLIVSNNINFHLFFLLCSISVIFVSLDLIFQYHFGKDIFGIEGSGRRLGGPFGDELVAGSFLQRFSFFLFFFFLSLQLIKRITKKSSIFLFLILSSIIIFGLVMAGNRVPLLMFLIISILIFIFNSQNRIYFFFIILTTVGIFTIMYNSNLETRYHYGHFKNKVSYLLNTFTDKHLVKENDLEKAKTSDEKYYVIKLKDKNYRITSSYVLQFYSGYETWKQNKIFGGGLKSFKINCPKVLRNCSTHPHNYYLEILSDLGIIGFVLICFIGVYIIYKSFLVKNRILTPFIYLFLIEIFPFKTTGSFFTTSNSTYIFLILAVIAGYSLNKKFI